MQAELIEKLRNVTQGAHYIDILVRRGGRNECIEGDFLKDILRLLEGDADISPHEDF